jgi:hypothetical protein
MTDAQRGTLLSKNCWRYSIGHSEIGPTKDKDGYNIGYAFPPASWLWFLTFKEAISAAEIAFNASLDSGFHEVRPDTRAVN